MPRFKPKAEAPFSMTAEQVARWFVEGHPELFLARQDGREVASVEMGEMAIVWWLTDMEWPNDGKLARIVATFVNECEDWFEREVK